MDFNSSSARNARDSRADSRNGIRRESLVSPGMISGIFVYAFAVSAATGSMGSRDIIDGALGWRGFGAGLCARSNCT